MDKPALAGPHLPGAAAHFGRRGLASRRKAIVFTFHRSSGRPGRFAAAILGAALVAGILPGVALAATAPTITSAASTTFTVGVAGTFTVTTTGVPTPTITRGGVALPSGVTFTDNGDGTGTLAGTPASATNGSYAITFTAANGTLPDVTQNFTLTVALGTVPTITSAASTTFTVGIAGTFAVTTTGLPTPTITRGGAALPSGVTFTDNGNGTGTLAGTPASGTNGSYAITFTATNANGSSTVQNFTLTVGSGTAPLITSVASTTFTVGIAGTFTVTTTGVPAPTITRGGVALPSGVTFTNNGNGTGTLAGTPASGTNGSYAITFTATNGILPNATQNFTLIVAAAGPTVTINQASGQPDPTGTSPINFTVVFSAAVSSFTTGDVTISGTAGGTKVGTVTGSGTTYNVAVTGMTTGGTVIATIGAAVATATSGGLPNQASTSTDNTVTWVAATATITLTNSSSVITWGNGISLNVQFGTNGGNRSFIIEGARDGVTWVTIATLTTNASGQAALSYRPVTNLYYRARFLGATDLLAATSNTTRTVVRQIAILRPTNFGAIKSIARNTSITFTTTVRPARAGLPAAKVSFVFYRRIGGVWTRITTRNVFINSLGKASTTFKFTSAGSWYVRTIANPTPYNANSVWSPLERYSVR
jgi:hypothetical protein